nr:phosphatidylserine decarboxylase family protein [Bacteroidota bacterium]
MRIHREGYKIIAIIFVVLAASLSIINYYLPTQTVVHYLLYILSLFFFGFIIRFFRNPDRPLPGKPDVLISPADGKVVVIDEVEENMYFKEKRLKVSIFMSPNNVHKNWYPTDGKVVFFKYDPGKFLVAWHPKSSELNERTSVALITRNDTTILVRQIAGALAQRIVCYSKEGDDVTQGQEFGFIKFGSRVDMFLPLGTEVLVRKNQKVKGCITEIARL